MQNNLDVGIISINPTFSLSLVHPSFSTNSGMCMHTLLTQKNILLFSFMFTLGGAGFIILDQTHSSNTPKLNRLMLQFVVSSILGLISIKSDVDEIDDFKSRSTFLK